VTGSTRAWSSYTDIPSSAGVASNIFQVAFRVDSTETFELAGKVGIDAVWSASNAFQNDLKVSSIVELDRNGIPYLGPFKQDNFNDTDLANAETLPLQFDQTGILIPGSYSLIATQQNGEDLGFTNTTTLHVTLTGTAIPLPPAAFSALMGLIGLLAIHLVRQSARRSRNC